MAEEAGAGQVPDGLGPADDLFDAFADALAERVAGGLHSSSRATSCLTSGVGGLDLALANRHMRRGLMPLLQFIEERAVVVSRVEPHRLRPQLMTADSVE